MYYIVLIELSESMFIITWYTSLYVCCRAVRNRFLARCRKQIGDLCLLVDMPNEAVVQYQAAMDLLKAAGDDLWVGCKYILSI